MSYTPPAHFAVENRSTLASDRDLAYWTEGCRLQLERHVCPAWNLDPPGAAVYPRDATFAVNTAMVAVMVDDIGDPGTLGEHGLVGAIPFVLIDVHLSRSPSTVLSHEFIEATVNQWLDRWTTPIRRAGKTYSYPLEPCDAVEASSYQIPVDGLDGVRNVEVSNFVLPSWFDPASHQGQFDFLSSLTAPLEIADGGYSAPEIDGDIVFIGPGELHIAARKLLPQGRLARLIRKGPAKR